jgi:predicted RNA-binding protein with PIN domain
MAVERIVVDGPSLLERCPGLAAGKNSASTAVRRELLAWLTRYQDVTGTPITVVFDGQTDELDEVVPESGVEPLLLPPGQNILHAMQRLVHRLAARGPVQVVCSAAHLAQVAAWPGTTAVSCEDFARTVQSTLDAFEREMLRFNSQERNRFLRAS